jgi:hypothetical protein
MIRHLAAVPTETEQRCLRCQQVIVVKKEGADGTLCFFPLSEPIFNERYIVVPKPDIHIRNCEPCKES